MTGFTHHADGLITIIQHGQSHFHKRAYLCVKFLVGLCGRLVVLEYLRKKVTHHSIQMSSAV